MTLKSTELEEFFEYLKPITQKTKIQKLYLSNSLKPNTIDMCSSFVEGKIIPNMMIDNRPPQKIDL